MPTHNNASTIARCISSCLDQTYTNFELIIIDNGSNIDDTTTKIIDSFHDQRIHYQKYEFANRSKARNLGIKAARGDYLQFLDADDELYPAKLELAVAYLQSNPKFFAYADNVKYSDIRTNRERIQIVSYKYRNQLLGSNSFPINSVLFRNKDICYFNESISYNEDWLFWVDNLVDKPVFFSNEQGAIVNITGENTMSHYELMLIFQIYIRAIIKKKIHRVNLRLFLQDCRYGFRYLSLNVQDPVLNYAIKKQLKVEIFIVRLLIKVPVIKKRLNATERRNKQSNEYL